jgi:glutathione S-transferase
MKLYVDLLSQPCRALFLFSKATGIDIEVEKIKLMEGEHKKAPYSDISKFGTVTTYT